MMTPGGYNRGRRLEHDGKQLATQHNKLSCHAQLFQAFMKCSGKDIRWWWRRSTAEYVIQLSNDFMKSNGSHHHIDMYCIPNSHYLSQTGGEIRLSSCEFERRRYIVSRGRARNVGMVPDSLTEELRQQKQILCSNTMIHIFMLPFLVILGWQ